MQQSPCPTPRRAGTSFHEPDGGPVPVVFAGRTAVRLPGYIVMLLFQVSR